MAGILQPSELDNLKSEAKKIINYGGLSSGMAELRTIILDSHFFIEELLISCLTKKFFQIAHHNRTKQGYNPSFLLFKDAISKFVEDIVFLKLVETAKDIEVIDEELKRKLRSINRARVVFAHPRGEDYKNFENDEEMTKWLLSTILEVLKQLANIDRGFGINEYK